MTTTEIFKLLLDKGWKIEPASCAYGGNYVWLKPRKSKSYETVGCICHTNLQLSIHITVGEVVL